MKRNRTLRALSVAVLCALFLSTLLSCQGVDTVMTTTNQSQSTTTPAQTTTTTQTPTTTTRPRPLPPELGPLRPTQSTAPSILEQTPATALSEAYLQELEKTVDSYAKIVCESAVNYIFITDLHVGHNDSSVKHQLDAILAIIDRMAQDDDPTNDIDFVVLGGDLTTGMFSSRKSYMAAMDQQLAPLRDCSIPVLILRGNHDDNSYWYMHGSGIKDSMTREEGQAHLDEATFGEEQWYTYMLHNYSNDDNTQAAPTSSRVHDVYNPDSAYYYYDLDAKKTRIICLDAIDNDLGKATVDKNGANFWGYSMGQFKWLYEQALTAPEGYNYIFFSHMAYHSATADSKAPHKYEYHYACKNFGILENILCAFQNKTSYILPGAGSMIKVNGLLTYQDYVCDFTNRTGKILSYQYGHHHADASYTDAKSMIPTMTTGTAGDYTSGGGMKIGGVGDYFSVSERRENGTITEALFDVVSVCAEKVYQIRFGAGDDNILDPKTAGQVNMP